MNYYEKALELVKLVDYDLWKECLETTKEEGGCMEVYTIADYLQELYDIGYDNGYNHAGGI